MKQVKIKKSQTIRIGIEYWLINKILIDVLYYTSFLCYWRPSVKDKVFDRDLQKALEISKLENNKENSKKPINKEKIESEIIDITDESAAPVTTQGTIILEENLADFKKDKDKAKSEKVVEIVKTEKILENKLNIVESIKSEDTKASTNEDPKLVEGMCFANLTVLTQHFCNRFEHKFRH